MNRAIAQSVAKNTTVMMFSQVVTWASSFVLMLYLPRYLGSETYGQLFLAISLTAIFQIVIEFGGGYFIAKEVSRDAEQVPVLLSNSVAIRFLLWFAGFILLLWISVSLGYSQTVIALIYILGFSKLWEALGKVFYSTYQGLEMMRYPAVGAMVERVTVTGLSVLALLMGANVVVIAILMALSTLLNFAVLSTLMKKIVPYLRFPKKEEMLRIARASVPYFVWMICSVIYYRIDAVMLSLMTPAVVVGWYGAAYRFFDVLMFLPSIFSLALLPALSKLWNNDHYALAMTTQKSLQFIIFAGIPVSIGVYAFSQEIIEFFFGAAEYGPSILLLKIFSTGLLLVYIDFVLGTALFAADRQRQWTLTAFCAMLLNPLLNYFFIPFTQVHTGNGGIGAAIATVVTEFFVMVMALTFLPQTVVQKSTCEFLYKSFAAGMLMVGTLWLLQGTGVPWFLTGAIALAVYLAGLMTLNAIDSSELNFLRSFFSYKNLKSLVLLSKEHQS